MNCRSIIEKFARLAGQRLYGISDFSVVFDDHLSQHGEEIRGLCRIGFQDLTGENCIYLHGKIFPENGWPPHVWNTIVHELSHIEVGIKHKGTLVIHEKKFYLAYRRNLAKVKDLRAEFFSEMAKVGTGFH